jgi:hypothetical protein
VGEVVLFSFQLALGIVVPWWIVRRDMRRLDDERLGRAWNDASLWMSVVAFGPLCLPFHYTKTRRSVWGLLLGLAWMVAAFFAIGLTASAVAFVLGVE